MSRNVLSQLRRGRRKWVNYEERMEVREVGGKHVCICPSPGCKDQRWKACWTGRKQSWKQKIFCYFLFGL